MAVIECANGHLYDTDQYGSCPYCGGNINRVEFGGGGADSYGATVAPGFGSTVAPGYGGGGYAAPTGGFYGSADIGKTVGAGMTPVSSAPSGGYGMDDVGATVAPSSYAKKKEAEEDESQKDTGKTVAVMSRSMSSAPVVGWLVCIEGVNKGKDFRLFAKNNTIGRSDKMDVCIKGDNTISRDNHARLAYDEKHNKYHLIPAESTNSIYVNEEPIYVPTIIKTGDIIELGESKFIFVALCGDMFSWRNGLASKGEINGASFGI